MRDQGMREGRGPWVLERVLHDSPAVGRDALGKSLNKERIADAAAAGAWGLFGLSFTQINEVLQFFALILTIVATGITIWVHIRKWLK